MNSDGKLRGACSMLEDLDKNVLVVLRDGRHVVGKLTSLDQFSNLVLEDASELAFAGKLVAKSPLGLMIVRSDNIVLVAQIDPTKEKDSPLKDVSMGELLQEEDRLESAANGAPVISYSDPTLWDFD